MSKEKVIEVKSLVKRYKDVIAVNGISFEVYRGEIFSLVGPNAAGKTTTVEILECLRTPTAGSATVLGFDVLKGEEEIKKRIGVMPQEFHTFDRLTVKENIELIARIYGIRTDITETMNTLGLLEVKNKKFGKLSGGMKRRVGIGMAIVSDPDILFLDEPTTGLDPQARRDTWEIIRNLKRIGKTVFLTTHYMEEVEKLSDRCSVIVKGELVATDTVENLLSTYGGGIKISVIGSPETEAKIEDILDQYTENVVHEKTGVLTGKFVNKSDAGKALMNLYQLDCKIEVHDASMNDVFLNLVGGKIDERGDLIW